VIEIFRACNKNEFKNTIGSNWNDVTLAAELIETKAIGVFAPHLVSFLLYRDLEVALEVSLLLTHPDYRQQGFMKLLMRHIMGMLTSQQEIWLEAHGENLAAQGLYMSLGLIPSGRRPNYYGPHTEALLYTYKSLH